MSNTTTTAAEAAAQPATTLEYAEACGRLAARGAEVCAMPAESGEVSEAEINAAFVNGREAELQSQAAAAAAAAFRVWTDEAGAVLAVNPAASTMKVYSVQPENRGAVMPSVLIDAAEAAALKLRIAAGEMVTLGSVCPGCGEHIHSKAAAGDLCEDCAEIKAARDRAAAIEATAAEFAKDFAGELLKMMTAAEKSSAYEPENVTPYTVARACMVITAKRFEMGTAARDLAKKLALHI